MRYLALLPCLLLLLAAPPARAWGPAGHRLVADLAERQLRPAARAEARRLLDGASLSEVAPWADELRNDPAQRSLWRTTSALHFVNFADASCRYAAGRDCPGGRCIVAAIPRYQRVLADRGRSKRERAEALRFVVHLVADVHQPLHAGYRPDRGGNRYQLRWQGRGTNLHSVWDSPVLASRGMGWRRQAELLAVQPPRASGSPADWAEESCRATRDAGIYPRSHKLDSGYTTRMRPLAERRVREAASRLAALLNDALGG